MQRLINFIQEHLSSISGTITYALLSFSGALEFAFTVAIGVTVGLSVEFFRPLFKRLGEKLFNDRKDL